MRARYDEPPRWRGDQSYQVLHVNGTFCSLRQQELCGVGAAQQSSPMQSRAVILCRTSNAIVRALRESCGERLMQHRGTTAK
jgi:hypothetical protein